MPKISFEFNDQEVATVLDGLASLPLSRSYALFQRLLGMVENENKLRAAAQVEAHDLARARGKAEAQGKAPGKSEAERKPQAEGQPFGQYPRVVQLEKPTPTPPVAEGL
jgi:hypothetical protein